MKCPKGQIENPEEAVFCIQCGARIVEEVSPTCPSCGTELPAGAQFCFKCGHPLAEPKSAPPLPSPEAWATFLAVKRDERSRLAQTLQIDGTPERVEEFLHMVGVRNGKSQSDSA